MLPVARRTHLKSRNGCLQCKRRKIKCDENGSATCAQCLKSRKICSFSPPPPIDLTFPTDALIDMELLHNFTTKTARSLSDCAEFQDFFSTNFVQLGLENNHLLHCILALSAFHIVNQQGQNGGRTDKYLLAAYSHHDKALKSYRSALSNLNKESCHAIFACSFLLFIISFSRPTETGHKSDESSISTDVGIWLDFQLSEWVILIKGLPSIIGQTDLLETLRQGLMGLLMASRDKIQKMMDDTSTRDWITHFQLRNLSEAIGKQSSDMHTREICQRALDALRDVLAELGHTHDTAFAFIWPTKVDPGYIVLLEERRPEALLVFAYYCVLLHLLSSRWFTKGWPRSVIESIRDTIDVKWVALLKWPLEIMMNSQAQAIYK